MTKTFLRKKELQQLIINNDESVKFLQKNRTSNEKCLGYNR
jgi:hypothetical protein